MLDFIITVVLIVTLIKEIPKIIQDTKDFIRILKGDIREEDFKDWWI